jgi:ubiquinone/menaquinone biosynthesis C-methylase UbiE
MGNNDRAKKSFEKIYSDYALWYDEYNYQWMKNSTNNILNQITIPENPTCLDVGCGTGISTFELIKVCKKKGKFYGIDISQKMVDQANRKNIENGYQAVFLKGDAENIPFPNEMFDLVLCNMSLTYFPDKLKALSEVFRVLKYGGQYAFTYNGGPSYQEGIQLALELAHSYPNLAEFRDSILITKNMLIDLEESVDLFKKAGLTLTAIYGRRDVNYSDPSIVVSEKNIFWSTWSLSIPKKDVDIIKNRLLERAKNVSSEKGFEHTSYEIFLWGKKTCELNARTRADFV